MPWVNIFLASTLNIIGICPTIRRMLERAPALRICSRRSVHPLPAPPSITTKDRQCVIENRPIYRQFYRHKPPTFSPQGRPSYHYCDVSVWNADNAGDIQEIGLDRNTVLYVVRPGRQLPDVVAGEDETVCATSATHARTHARTPTHARTHIGQRPHHTPATVTHTVASSTCNIRQLTT